jgi:hypothetical protein
LLPDVPGRCALLPIEFVVRSLCGNRNGYETQTEVFTTNSREPERGFDLLSIVSKTLSF